MKKSNIPGLIATCCLLVTNTVSATVVTLDGETSTGITGVTVGTTLYDVVFKTGTYIDVGGTSVFPFIGDSSGAGSAANAINSALQGLASSVGESSASPSTNYYVPYSYGAGGGNGVYSTASSSSWTNNSFNSYSGSVTFATMTVSTVPIPAAVWLFGSGLLGLVGMARRKT